MESLSNNHFFRNTFKGVSIAFLLTIILLSIFSCLLVFTNISENLTKPVVIGITAISILARKFYCK